MKTKFYSSIKEVPNIDWASMDIGDNPLFSFQIFELLENIQMAHTFCYITIENDIQEVIGFARTQLIPFNSSQILSQHFPCDANPNLKQLLLQKIKVSILVCGSLFACGENGFCYNPNKINSAEAYQVLGKALKLASKKHFKNKPTFILIKEFFPETTPNSDHIKTENYSDLFIDANMQMHIPSHWNNFEDYLKELRTKFRSKAKKVIKKSKDIELVDFNSQDILKHQNEIDSLYSSILKKAYFKIGQLNAFAFAEIKQVLQEQFIFTGYFFEGRLIGFSSGILTKNKLEAFHVGYNEEFKNSNNIYQSMLYNYLKDAIDFKVSQLQLGRTSETIKSGIGAKPTHMKLYIRHRNSIINFILSPVTKWVKPSINEIRTPFKKQVN